MVSPYAREEHGIAWPVRMEIGGWPAERDDANKGHGGEGRLDPDAAEWREEERQIGKGLGDAGGSMEQEEGRCEPQTVVAGSHASGRWGYV